MMTMKSVLAVQSRYASVRENVCLSATSVTAPTKPTVNVRKFSQHVQPVMYVYLIVPFFVHLPLCSVVFDQ